MSGGAFSCGISPVAPTTVFLGGGSVPERLTMLQPGHVELANGVVTDNSTVSGQMLNTWTSWNTTFYSGTNISSTVLGSFTTAPDGTSTAQHLAANTNNGFHFLSAVVNLPSGVQGFPIRVAFIASKAELTRCVLMVDDMNGLSVSVQQGNNGYKTVFDLAGGQVGVANTSFGSGGWTANPATIQSIGGSFYLCTVDGIVGTYTSSSPINAFRVSLWIDNGSGSGAQSTSFTGDGTSGINIWKSSCLPPQAWPMGAVVFFDDFTSLSTIDVNDTRHPGFNWYVHLNWPSHNYNLQPQHSNPGQFSQAGSILTCGTPVAQTDLCMSTCAPDGLGGHIGTSFSVPALFECRCAYDVTLQGGGSNYSGTPTFWTTAIEAIQSTDPPANSATPYVEYDFFEAEAGGTSGVTPHTSAFAQEFSGAAGSPNTMNSSVGFAKWYSGFQYATNTVIWYQPNNHLYKALDFPSTTLTPPSNAAEWSDQGALPAGSVGTDFAAQNLYSTLWLPDIGPTGRQYSGVVLQFFNGIHPGFGSFWYGRNRTTGLFQDNDSVFNAGDKWHYQLMVGNANNANIYIDYVKVTQ